MQEFYRTKRKKQRSRHRFFSKYLHARMAYCLASAELSKKNLGKVGVHAFDCLVRLKRADVSAIRKRRSATALTLTDGLRDALKRLGKDLPLGELIKTK